MRPIIVCILVVSMALHVAACGEPASPPFDGGVLADAALRAPVDAGTVGAACVATLRGPCGPASPACCAGLVCMGDVCLRPEGAFCQFPWECASDTCLLPASMPGASRCASPRE